MGVTLDDFSAPSIAPSASSNRTRPLALRRCVMNISAADAAVWAWLVGVAAREEEVEVEVEGVRREEEVGVVLCCWKSRLQLSCVMRRM